MFLQHSCSFPFVIFIILVRIPSVLLRTSCSMLASFLHYSCNIPAVFLQYSFRIPSLFFLCSFIVPSTLLQHHFISVCIPSVFFCYSFCMPSVFLPYSRSILQHSYSSLARILQRSLSIRLQYYRSIPCDILVVLHTYSFTVPSIILPCSLGIPSLFHKWCFSFLSQFLQSPVDIP